MPVSPFCPFPFVAGVGCTCWLGWALVDADAAVMLAYSPHLGQAPAPPSNEYKQPQKQATSAITHNPLVPPPPYGPCGR
jgi:hypothetical protein